MKKDLDSLMQAHQLDALLVTGSAQGNAAMYYLTGGGHISGGDLLKKRGSEPVLFCNAMERDEAAKTGLPIRNLGDYRYQDLLKECGGDHVKATVARYQKMLTEYGIRGRVGLYGKIDAGVALTVFSALQAVMPEITLVGEITESTILHAMMTKDDDEVARIRRMGQVTTTVVGEVAQYLTSQRVKDGALVHADGLPVTIGEVKNLINLWLAEHGADNPAGTIFGIGRDAGVPHSAGAATDLLRLGQTIVFDIYPCEAGSGYFYDFTRTWCLGYAPDEAQALYEQVKTVYHQVVAGMKLNAPFKASQELTCDLFEAMGHPTIRTNPQTQEGYVHSIGHGVGLQVHERPASGTTSPDSDILAPGVIVTIEPGLYYPERGMGVRLEDTLWMRPDGTPEVLADFPMELVLPVKA